MSSAAPSKQQQTAYERWEMSSFAQSGAATGDAGQSKRKLTNPASAGLNEALESIRKDAYAKGLQEGFTIGMAKAKEQALQENQQITELANAFSDALKMADEKIEESILLLALDLAKSMLKVKLKVDHEVILPIVKDAMRFLPYVQAPAKVLVNPEDAKILRVQLADELTEQAWVIEEDENIERGGCLVETDANQIDATNTTRWTRISEALSQNNDWLVK